MIALPRQQAVVNTTIKKKLQDENSYHVTKAVSGHGDLRYQM
jgi:hypothetical protein